MAVIAVTIISLIQNCENHPLQWLLIDFVISLLLTTLLHEGIHALIFLIGKIGVAAIICFPVTVFFYPTFKLRFMPSLRLFSGGEVVPDLYSKEHLLQHQIKVTKLSLLLAPISSALIAVAFLLVHVFSHIPFCLFMFSNGAIVVINSFCKTSDEEYGDILAYKKMREEEYFPILYYCNNVLLIHGANHLQEMFSETFCDGIVNNLVHKDSNEYIRHIQYLQISLLLGGYSLPKSTLQVIESSLPSSQDDYSEIESAIALRIVCFRKSRSMDPFDYNINQVPYYSQEICYLIKQTEALCNHKNNEEYLTSRFRGYMESINALNAIFSGYSELELRILRNLNLASDC